MFDDRLKKLREARGLNQKEVATELGLPTSTYAGYETNKREPDSAALIKIGAYFGVTLDYLLDYHCDSPNNFKHEIFTTSNAEKEHIKKYRVLDDHGKKMIDLVLNEEYTRCTTTPAEEHDTIQIRHSAYKVSAGRGFDLDDRDSWEEIEIPDTPEARKADFAVTIIGDSMEPIYSDGQIVLVREQPSVDIGETGVYIVNGGGFIKQNGGDRLISINPEYDDIFFDESDSVYCAGKVIGVI